MSEAQQAWDAATQGWVKNADLLDRLSMVVQDWLMRHLDLAPGETLLDIATGYGPIAFPAAEIVGGTGRVIATDISPNMLEAARRRGEERGAANVTYVVMDAQALELPDDSVDAVAHRYGPMLLPEPARAFADARRVLRPGGRYVASVWSTMAANPWNGIVVQAAVDVGIIPEGGEQTQPGAMNSLSDPDRLRELLGDAGFGEVVVEHVDHPQHFTSFDEYWKLPTEIAGGFAQMLSKQPAEVVTQLEARMRELAEPYGSGDGYSVPAQTICAFAR